MYSVHIINMNGAVVACVQTFGMNREEQLSKYM